MNKKPDGRGKLSTAATRIMVVILVLLLFTGTMTLPLLASTSRAIAQLANNYYLPIIFNNVFLGPTPTATVSGTPPTAGPSPTNTLIPSPTYTGTLTPNPSLSITVSPTSAKVGDSFTFTIIVGSVGTGPTSNNILVDSFPTYLDVLTVTTTQGTINKQSHSFIISIGNVNPGVIVTIVATVRVNSTLTRTETISNVAALTYNEVLSKTASVTYQVVVQTLPGTGELPLSWNESVVQPLTLLPGILLMLSGAVLLVLVIVWSKARTYKYKLWMTVGGALLFLVGFIIAVASAGVFQPVEQAGQSLLTPTEGNSIAQGQPQSTTTLEHKPASAFSTPDYAVPMVTLPNYPVPSPVISVTPQPGQPEPDSSDVTRIAIPVLMLDTEVKYVPYDGVTWLINGLRQEVAWMGNTSWPGLGSNTALAGHITVAGMGDGPFRHLDELPVGELVLLYTERNIYTYQVRESKITDDADMSVTLPTTNPQITLITCVDWDQDSRTYLNRLVVIADLVDTEPITIGMAP